MVLGLESSPGDPEVEPGGRFTASGTRSPDLFPSPALPSKTAILDLSSFLLFLLLVLGC